MSDVCRLPGSACSRNGGISGGVAGYDTLSWSCVAVNQTRRDEINRQIKELAAKRAHYVKKELSKHVDAKKGFDFQVVESLRAQAARKGITYK